MFKIHPIPAFNDNYIWIVIDEATGHACCVDPGDADPVLDYLNQHQLKLENILITHHHHDHIGGLKQLKQATGAKVYGPAHIKGVDTPVTEADTIQIFTLSFQVISVPGHTLDHLAYYNDAWLFCGDTLFSIGCGRVFEGTHEQMFASLNKLKALPDDLLVCCAHEYTMANIHFAQSLASHSPELADYQKIVENKRAQNIPSLPSKLGLEKQLNPFLNCTDLATFSQRRHLKDQA